MTLLGAFPRRQSRQSNVGITTLRVLFLILFVGFAVCAGPSGAQNTSNLDQAASALFGAEEYEAWNSLAERAEEVIEAGRASNAAFSELRAQLAAWRDRFTEAQGQNAVLVTALEARLSALGPVPETPEDESASITALRSELAEQLQQLTLPRAAALDGTARSDVLIREIDRLLRTRQSQSVMKRGPSPLALGNIDRAIEDLLRIASSVAAEARVGAELEGGRGRLASTAPTAILVILVASFLLYRGRGWGQAALKAVARAGTITPQQELLLRILSLASVMLPALCIYMIAWALQSTELFGAIGSAALNALGFAGVIAFSTIWLGHQVFPKLENFPRPLDLDKRTRRHGRVATQVQAVCLALFVEIFSINDTFSFQDGALEFLIFPPTVAMAMALVMLGRILRSAGDEYRAKPAPDDADPVDSEPAFLGRVLRGGGRVLIVFAMVGMAAAALGYLQAAQYAILSTSLTLALIAVVAVLQRVATSLLRLVGLAGPDGSEGLWPLLVNLVLMIGSLPFLTLIWGARVTDLTELWSRFLQGVAIGETTIRPSDIALFLVVFFAGYLLTRLIQGILRVSVLPRMSFDTGGRRAVEAGAGYIGVGLAILLAVSVAGIDLTSLALVAGALSVGIGFGLQNIVSNFVSGIILLIERPVSEGDWVEVGGVMGTVRKISVRSTRIETFDRTDVIVPNSDFVTSHVVNWTKQNLTGRLILPVGVAYGSDPRAVERILRGVAEAHPLVILNPPPLVLFMGFGDSALDFEVRVILRDINFVLSARSELNHAISTALKDAGIEIPFPQRDLWLKNPETLTQSRGVQTEIGDRE